MADVPQGHGQPCYYCGEACNALHGNPGLWPLPFCHRDDPGVTKWHHTSCVTKRLIENQPTVAVDAEFFVNGVRFASGDYVIRRVGPTTTDVSF
jgi:hypothetical protein